MDTSERERAREKQTARMHIPETSTYSQSDAISSISNGGGAIFGQLVSYQSQNSGVDFVLNGRRVQWICMHFSDEQNEQAIAVYFIFQRWMSVHSIHTHVCIQQPYREHVGSKNWEKVLKMKQFKHTSPTHKHSIIALSEHSA